MKNNMTNKKIEINLTGTIKISSNNCGIANGGITTTSTANICKFEPVQPDQIVGSANNSPCVKCGKQAWEHPIITYTQL